ncbi:hypothetical protein [Salinivibrio kushneri]|nr:hypothetical protein [Salinivibrio kushneri]
MHDEIELLLAVLSVGDVPPESVRVWMQEQLLLIQHAVSNQ